MTAPGVNKRGVTPGESEYSWGAGLLPNPVRGYEPDNRDRLMAIRQTDTTNPAADVEALFKPGVTQGTTDDFDVVTPGNMQRDSTPLVTEVGPSSSVGANRRLNPLKARGGVIGWEPDGLQDGSGAAWRASLPPNPVV